jgi:excisionase family DNA binding protein
MEKIILTTPSELEALIYGTVSKALTDQQDALINSPTKLLSVSEAAQYLGIAIQTLYGFTSNRVIPFIKKGKKVQFLQSDLDQWLLSGRHEAVTN